MNDPSIKTNFKIFLTLMTLIFIKYHWKHCANAQIPYFIPPGLSGDFYIQTRISMKVPGCLTNKIHGVQFDL